MATLTITTNGNTDFRGGPAEASIDKILFQTPGPGNSTAIFAPAQFGAGLISNTVEITGDANQNRIRVDFAAATNFSAAGWKFVNWGADDETQLFGSTGSDTITGSAQRDNIATSNGLANGIDVISAGNGNDKIQMTGNSFAAGTKVDGGNQDAGGFDEVTSNGANDDLTLVAFSNVERLSRISNGQTTIVNGKQIGAGGFTQLAADGARPLRSGCAAATSICAGWTLSSTGTPTTRSASKAPASRPTCCSARRRTTRSRAPALLPT